MLILEAAKNAMQVLIEQIDACTSENCTHDEPCSFCSNSSQAIEKLHEAMNDENIADRDQIETARDRYQSDTINIDNVAFLSDAAPAGYWVQAWVWIDT